MSSQLDAESIADSARLLRRVHPDQVVMDGNTGHHRPSSAVFKDPESSVDREVILLSQGLDWKFSLRNFPEHSLVSFPAKAARDLGLTVSPDELPDNKSHAVILGKKTKGIANGLRDAASWIHLKGAAIL